MRASMLIPLAGLIVGLLCAMWGMPLWGSALFIAVAVILHFVITSLSKNPLTGFRLNRLHDVWILLAFAGVGIISWSTNSPEPLNKAVSTYVAVQGRVEAISNRTDGDRAEIRVLGVIDSLGNTEHPRNLKMLVRSDAMKCDVDDEILMVSEIRDVKDSPNWFTTGYAERMHNRGILYETLCEGDSIKITGQTFTLTGFAAKQRGKLEAFVENTRLKQSTKKFLITVLLGDRAYLDPDLRDSFADAGISHMLALSGMHVAIIAGIILWLLFPINFLGLFKWRMLLAAVILLVYAFLTGLAPSTVRATLMMFAMIVCVFLERKNTAWNSLLLATFIILLFDPRALTDVGLQLSFMCVAALIFFVNPLNPIRQHDHERLYSVVSTVLATLVATLATWCVTTYYFGTIPVMFLPANLMALPLLPAYLVGAVIYFCLAFVGLEPGWCAWLIDIFPELLQMFLRFISDGEKLALEFTPSLLSVWLWVITVALTAVVVCWRNTRLTKALAATALTCFIISLAIPLDAGATSDAFIVRNFYPQISMLVRENGKEYSVNAAEGTVSEVTLAGQRLIVADCHTGEAKGRSCDLLVIGGGISDELDEILVNIEASKIIVHPTVRRKREQRILLQADSLGVPCHSIRRDGPYRYDRTN